MNDLIITLFREHIGREVPLTELDDRAERIVAGIGGRSPHLELTAVVVAGYQCLLARMPQREALVRVARAFHEPTRPHGHDSTRAALDAAEDPFAVIVGYSKDREENYFGADFAFERTADDDERYLVDVRRCFYVEVLARCGVPELGPVFCEFDAAWISAIDPDRHGIDFRRPTTIARGGATCPFHFRRRDVRP
ncbi:L-2-amino-thiazoline-4-carboxylic acid hydrolase [Saccharothrix coeruleofusca]|uniref:L-2-amino-thiazoline-4-carboxylic acid hydrolase-like protein n=1 Tax=Saccharothrix coeruleofusca TaxID=33919 RepID=A0A918AGR6_9PSEU|nr:L-2-amino-thiazoline-4-carboxylic acid hydrolase [Saccharothrix coeruleofusca]MBP2340444.1 hypothetical protein [Saccharothrix coeruleofusca]GGP35297.1 hypothetical protein GCM10010185_02680 [Saccharothrix coeruleofusca]